ncbi:hypothetical protein [Thalassospira xiamenensis]|uniref:hypothetical protein n=1 Tax=Thalassospira xiamenensis TaxID=220697 RepID=UPI0011BD9440|nr:hypothetical protein [Thalassospira xiamenensis]
MLNIKNWWPVYLTVLVAALSTIWGITADIWGAGCSTVYCNIGRKFQWETMSAGLLGLAGGLSVISAMRRQIEHDAIKQVHARMVDAFSLVDHIESLEQLASLLKQNLEKAGKSELNIVSGLAVYTVLSGDTSEMDKAASGAMSSLRRHDNNYLETQRNSHLDLPPQCYSILDMLKSAVSRQFPQNNRRIGNYSAAKHYQAMQSVTTIIRIAPAFKQLVLAERKRRISDLMNWNRD